jgi:hypothetical protein
VLAAPWASAELLSNCLSLMVVAIVDMEPCRAVRALMVRRRRRRRHRRRRRIVLCSCTHAHSKALIN